MTTLADLLRRLDREDVLIAVEGGRLKWSAPRQLEEELRAEILRHRAELLELFRDPPTWPPARGRSGPLVGWTHAAGDAVRLRDGREGILAALLYDTRTGHCRCRVGFLAGEALVDADEVLPSIELRRLSRDGPA